jgi:hypothetical protein
VRAAVYWRVLGDTLEAESLLRAAKARLHASDAQMQELIARIEMAMKKADEED